MKKVIFLIKISFLVLSLFIIPLTLYMAPALLLYDIDTKTTAIGYGYLIMLIILSTTSYIILKGLLEKTK